MHEPEILRPASRDDGPDWYRWRSEGSEAFVEGLPFSLESHRSWFETRLGDPQTRMWTVVHAGRPVGMVGLTGIDHRHQAAEMAWVYIDPAARGIGASVARKVVHLGFCELNLHRIYLTVLAENTRAIRCYEKAGFRIEGRLRDAVYKGGERRDLLLMALLRSDPEIDQTRAEATPSTAPSLATVHLHR